MDEMDIDGEDDKNIKELSETSTRSKSETNLNKYHVEDKDSPINHRPKKGMIGHMHGIDIGNAMDDVETIGTIRKNDKDEQRTPSLFANNHIGNLDVSNIDLIASTRDIHNIDITDDHHGKEEVDENDDKFIYGAGAAIANLPSIQSPKALLFANKEMMNPTNNIPTTAPSIFSPTANYQ